MSLLVTNLNKAKYSIYEKLSNVFSVAGFRFEEKQSHQLHYFTPVADPEVGPGPPPPPLFLDQTKNVFGDQTPQSKGLDDGAPTYLKVWIRHCNQPIFSCNENPFFWYLVIYSSLLDSPSHSQGQIAIEDNDKNKTIVILSSSLFPSGKLPVRM